MPHLDAVLVVAQAVLVLPVKLVDLNFIPIATADALKDLVCQWVICFMPSIMAFVPSFGVRPEGPCTRNGFQRSSQGAKQYR